MCRVGQYPINIFFIARASCDGLSFLVLISSWKVWWCVELNDFEFPIHQKG
jgi:hypothetical protein